MPGRWFAILGVAFAIYGFEGPPDDERVNSLARFLGFLYGLYAVALIAFWVSGSRSKG